MRSGTLPSESIDCIGGRLVFVGQDAFCVYLDSESDQECSDITPYGIRVGSTWVCSDDPDPPSQLTQTAIFLAQYPEGIPAEEVDALTGSVENSPDAGPDVETDGDLTTTSSDP